MADGDKTVEQYLAELRAAKERPIKEVVATMRGAIERMASRSSRYTVDRAYPEPVATEPQDGAMECEEDDGPTQYGFASRDG